MPSLPRTFRSLLGLKDYGYRLEIIWAGPPPVGGRWRVRGKGWEGMGREGVEVKDGWMTGEFKSARVFVHFLKGGMSGLIGKQCSPGGCASGRGRRGNRPA